MTSALEKAIAALRAGDVVGIPTDTVYGLAVDPFDQGAVDFLFALKERDLGSPLPVLGASAGDLAEVADLDGVGDAAATHWPGALTLVVPVRSGLAAGVGTGTTVAVRVPDHPVALELLAGSGPLAVTSANRSGSAPAVSDREAAEMFGDAVAVYLPGRSREGTASTIIDTTGGRPVVVRDGPVTWDADE